MAYKKPEVVAKSEAKQSLVGGCPTNKAWPDCCQVNRNCMAGPVK